MADAGIVPTCTLGKGKANIFLDGNPIVYGGAVETVSNNGTSATVTGDPVLVVDHVGAVVGWGVYNADSMVGLALFSPRDCCASKHRMMTAGYCPRNQSGHPPRATALGGRLVAADVEGV